MGTKTVKIKFCDACGKEITGRLTLHTCPCCHKDICVSCQAKEDGKGKPKAEKKPSPEVIPPPDTEASLIEAPEPEPPEDNVYSSELTIEVPVQEGDKYHVNISGSDAFGPTLRLAVLAALEEWSGQIPKGLSAGGKAILEAIIQEDER